MSIQDGLINRTEEIVLTEYAESATTDLEALIEYFDTNQDKQFDKSDKDFDDFYVWNDANLNGLSEPGELFRLNDLGIESIELEHATHQGYQDGDTYIHNTGSVNYSDGKQGQFADVAFSFVDLNPGVTDIIMLGVTNELNESI